MDADDERDLEDILSRGRAARVGRRGRKSLYEAPEFTKRLNAFTEANAGTNVVFECQWKGFPRPTLRWYKDDEPVVASDRSHISEADDGTASLTLIKVMKGDEAAYKCKAENSEGVTSTTGYLSVIGDNTDKPLSAQGRQSEHAVSNPPPLRTIIEQRSMEEREEDAYPQPSTSPVDEILEEAARHGQGWPAMLGLKARRKGKRKTTEDDYDSGSDTSVDSQLEDSADREATPDADLVIDEGNLLPRDGQTESRENGTLEGVHSPKKIRIDSQADSKQSEDAGAPYTEVPELIPAPMETEGQYHVHLQRQERVQEHIEEAQKQTERQPESPTQVSQCTAALNKQEELAADASLNGYHVEESTLGSTGLDDGYHADVTQNVITEPYTQMSLAPDVTPPIQPPEGSSITMRDDSPIHNDQTETEKQKSIESGYVTEELDTLTVQEEPSLVVPEAVVAFPEALEGPAVFAAIEKSEVRHSPEKTEQPQHQYDVQKSPEEACISYTPKRANIIPNSPEGADIPLSPERPDIPQSPEEADIPLRHERPDIPHSPEGADIPVSPERSDIPHSPEEADIPVSPERPDIHQSPEEADIPLSPERPDIHQSNIPHSPEAAQLTSMLESSATEKIHSHKELNPLQATGNNADESQPRPEAIPESQYTSASNPFRSPATESSEEMIASYTRTFSSTIDEEENVPEQRMEDFTVDNDQHHTISQAVMPDEEDNQPIIHEVVQEVITTHDDEIVTMATVQTARLQDSTPFPWGPFCFFISIAGFIGNALEISISAFLLYVFLLSIFFHVIVGRQKHKKE